MAKLERMYRNKLCVKGPQPVAKKNAASNTYCRPTWEKSSYQPLNLHKSSSDSDLSDPLGSSSSDGSDQELALEANGSETGSSVFGKERIEKMWDGFSVEDYISRSSRHSLPSSPAFRMAWKKQKAWSPKVTVPKPFQMTIREARKKEQNIKSKSQIEMENNLLRKQLEEEAECQKKFRANPVPAAVFLPLYHDIVQRNEERRRSVKERSQLRLLASQKPFKFLEREKQRKEIRKIQRRDPVAPENKPKPFKAKPVPKCVYSATVTDKLKEKELFREIRIRMRAEELLRNSSLPTSRLALANTSKKKKHKCFDPKEPEQRSKIKSSVPDFEALHEKFQQRLLQQKQVRHLTVCQPFNLRTPCIPSNKGKILKDIQMDEEQLKETRWPFASPRCKPQTRHSSAHSHLSGAGKSRSPKSTESTRRRLQAIRNYEKQRMQEYLQELQEMKERVKERPLLFERVTQRNARIAAEKHYLKRLRALGICPDFVSKKGQAALSQRYSSAEDLTDSTGARARVFKGRLKERESSDEAPDSSTHSEQSCEEEEEEKERKDVKASTQSSELEDEEEARASPHAHEPCSAGKAGSSPTSAQHYEEDEDEEGRADVSLGRPEEQDDDQSRPSSQSDQSYEHEEESQSEPEAEDDFTYEDEEYESDDSEEKHSDDEDD
ncbi:F161A protein, partial [Rhinopomastus cyanomelas]|nr:F161A protein [Rhinopomastus cyanomelas]